MSLITSSELLEVLPDGPGGDTAVLDKILAGLGRAFARFCGYPPATAGANPTMESASYTRFLDGPEAGSNGRDLQFDVWPLTAVTSVYDDPTLDFTSSSYLVPSSDYAIPTPLGAKGIIRLTSTATWGRWGSGRGRIRVVGTAGYGTVPDDLKWLARQGGKHWWELRRRQGLQATMDERQQIQLREEDFLPRLVRQGLVEFMLPTRMGIT